MKSPFPGMDPYLERRGLWEGFHNHLIEEIYRTLAPALPRRYTIDTTTRSYVVLLETEGKKEHLAKPDVTVTEPAARRPRKQKGGVAVAKPAAESVPMRAFISEKFEERFIEIYTEEEEEERLLITCIEVLSLSNKRANSEGWKEYTRKRQALLLGQANLVEIDLLRGGHKMPMLDTWPDSPYSLLVCRSDDAPYCRAWPAHFRHRLPVIPV